MKTLIVFYSKDGENWYDGKKTFLKEGNGRIISSYLKELIPDADTFEIKMKNPYSMDYDICVKEAYEDQKNHVLPEILNPDFDISGYERIFLVYPIYWESCPQAVLSFVSHHDFKNKEVILISSHEGSGLGSSVYDIQETGKNLHIKKALPIAGSLARESKDTLQKFLSGITGF